MITIHIEGLEQLKNNLALAKPLIDERVKWAMVQSVNAVKNSAQDLAPYKTGTLRRSIFTDIQDNGFTGIVAQDPNISNYGIFMEYGTPAHDILPVNKKALFWKGALYPVRVVHHPGTAPHPFMQPAMEQNTDVIQGYFEDAIHEVNQAISNI